jgi:uncharacterized membrane protein YfhO
MCMSKQILVLAKKKLGIFKFIWCIIFLCNYYSSYTVLVIISPFNLKKLSPRTHLHENEIPETWRQIQLL